MSDLNLNASASIGPSTPFCPRTYFHGLREAGSNPLVRGGGLRWLVGESSTSNLNKWAALHDEDGAVRLQYARDAWAERTSDDDVILLGTLQ